MRKGILTFSLLFAVLLGYSQFNSLPVKDQVLIYADTIYKVDSVAKAELFSRAKLWISENFKSSKYTIDLEDKEGGVIVGKARSAITVPTNIGTDFNTYCHYTFKCSFKDGKVRVEMYDLFYKIDHSYYSGGVLVPETETYPKTWFLPSIGKKMVVTCQGYKDESLRIINEFYSSLQAGLHKPYIDDNW